MSEVVALQETP